MLISISVTITMEVTKCTVILNTRVPSLSTLKTHYDTPIPVIIMFFTLQIRNVVSSL